VDIISGGLGNDTVLGGKGADQINGDEDADVLAGELGRDVIHGGIGDDTLKAFVDNALRASVATSTGLALPAITAADPASLERDILFGDANNDSLFGSPTLDTLDGGTENDLLFQSDVNGGDNFLDTGGIDAFVVPGTAAADTISITLNAAGRVTVLGANNVVLGVYGANETFVGVENLRILAGEGNDTVTAAPLGQKVPFAILEIFGEGGNDTVNVSSYEGKTLLDGGIGDDTLTGSAKASNVISGGEGNDKLTGGAQPDTITGDGGDDRIDGGAGDDRLSGDTPARFVQLGLFFRVIPASGNGNDVINAGAGKDNVDGGDGNDKIDGGADDDVIDGGGGDDLILAGSGNDTARGGAGNDTIYGMSGNDRIEGNDGNDLINGDGVSFQFGGADAGFLVSDNLPTDGNDVLIGGRGGDRVFGNGGNDLIDNSSDGTPDQSTDRLDGGVGFDTAKVSFKNKQTFVNFESVQVVGGGQTFIGADQTVYGLEGATVWANGQEVNTDAFDFAVNQRGELFVQTRNHGTSSEIVNKLLKYTRNSSGLYGTPTRVASNIIGFELDKNGNPVVERPPPKP
jgi:Ca2+-binding RTX toxin-like protein